MARDAVRSAGAVGCAVLLVGAVEMVLGLPFASRLDAGPPFVAIGIAVSVCAAVLAAVLAAAAAALVRMLLALAVGRETAQQWNGPFPDERGDYDGGRAAAWIHGIGAGAAVLVAGTAWTTTLLFGRFHSVALMAAGSAALSLGWLVAAAVVAVGVARALRAAPDRQATFRGPRLAVAVWIAATWFAALAAVSASERFAMVFPLGIAVGLTAGAAVVLWLSYAAPVVLPRVRRVRLPLIGGAAVLACFAVLVVGWFGDSDNARRAVLRRPNLAVFSNVILAITDVDGDGYSHLLGGGDCAPLDADLHPGARDIANDGIDQNCSGADYEPAPRPSPVPDVPVPSALRGERNVLLVTVDTLRYDHLGFAGYSRITSPRLDALAARGAHFENAYSPSYTTWFALPALLTSQTAEELGLPVRGYGAGRPPRLPLDAVTLPEVLRAAGYRTAMFTSFYYFDDWQLDQGIEHFVNEPERGRLDRTAAQLLTDHALEWMADRAEGERWFVWIHYIEPHQGYVTHEVDFGSSAIDRYDSEIRHVDTQIGRLVDWLDDHAQASRTLIAVTSDHGEGLGEHGVDGHEAGMWEMLIRVPLIVVVPGAVPRRVATPASTLDLAPTLAAFAGVDPDPSWTGRAHVDEIANGRDHPERTVFSSDPIHGKYAAITTGYKLVRDEYRNIQQLVDLNADPGEEEDASSREPEMRARLERALDQFRGRVLGAEPPRYPLHP